MAGPLTDTHTSTRSMSEMARYSQRYTQDVDKDGAQYQEISRGDILPAQRPAAPTVSVGDMGDPPPPLATDGQGRSEEEVTARCTAKEDGYSHKA